MFHRRSLATLIGGVAIVSLSAIGCGPSQEEYQAKMTEVAKLQKELEVEQSQNKKAKAKLDEASNDIAALKEKLAAAGVDVSNLGANAEQQARALEDYRRRQEQIDQTKRRYALLRDKLQPLSKSGLTVTTRNNRVVIQLTGEALFDPKRDVLKKEGQEVLLKVAEIIRNDSGLAGRSFQVAGHVESAPAAGGSRPPKDTWATSLTRAREVLAFLVQPSDKGGGGLSPSKWSASGYGDTDPPKAGAAASKEANRCEIVVQPSPEEMLDLRSLTQ